MKTVVEFISQLYSQEIRLFVDGEYLGYDAPEGVLTPQLRSELIERKEEILELLRRAEASSRSTSSSISMVPRDTGLPLSFSQLHNHATSWTLLGILMLENEYSAEH